MKRRSYGDGTIDTRGYRKIFRGNKQVYEHRWLGAEFLGRPLLTTENVHHRNGNNAENTIGPCFLQKECTCSTRHNLELWSTSQPRGQRVEDKIAWAKEILKLYG